MIFSKLESAVLTFLEQMVVAIFKKLDLCFNRKKIASVKSSYVKLSFVWPFDFETLRHGQKTADLKPKHAISGTYPNFRIRRDAITLVKKKINIRRF